VGVHLPWQASKRLKLSIGYCTAHLKENSSQKPNCPTKMKNGTGRFWHVDVWIGLLLGVTMRFPMGKFTRRKTQD
jgi:N-acetylneuraminic acid mutarotase